MSQSLRYRLLDAIRDNQPVANLIDLVPITGAGTHEMTHVLHRLKKQGLVTFKVRTRDRRLNTGWGHNVDSGIPTDIRLRR